MEEGEEGGFCEMLDLRPERMTDLIGFESLSPGACAGGSDRIEFIHSFRQTLLLSHLTLPTYLLTRATI